MNVKDQAKATALIEDLADLMHYKPWRRLRDEIANALTGARAEGYSDGYTVGWRDARNDP